MSNFLGGFLKKIKLVFTLFLLIIMAMIITSPLKFINACMNGISAWAFNVLPSILPFIIFTRILTDLNMANKFTKPLNGLFAKAYRTSPLSCYVFFMSILSGYPVGSKMIADLYENRKISKEDVYKMSSFCSNSGPMFIVGTVGTMLLQSPLAGYLILISHILSALLNGLIFRKMKVKTSPLISNIPLQSKEESSFNLGDIILSSVQAILSVGAIIAVFFIVIECLLPAFALLPSPFKEVFEGLVEITRGCIDLSKLAGLKLKTALCCFVVTFGGFSTILQSIALLKKVKMPIWLFTLQKLSQAILSLIICFILSLIFL